ncbi:MAG: 3'(2'),5'-bisphosphate nucleotidase CysQ [Pseudomonadota bacterium]|nr:3'(2'),5'-bisphosphate nucleotidase CysQ [Pseudomonadota bacterium]
MSFFRRNPNAWAKDGGSPVTEADMAVDDFLKAELLAERPRYGWLSEETADDLVRLERETIFVVDPIDGTRGFIEGDDRWCMSLALVRSGRPIAAALYAPARGEFYHAATGQGAWLGERRLAVSSRPHLAGARLGGPRAWLKSAAFTDTGAAIQSHVPSLAYRFVSVASGAFDAAFASPRAHDWDLAACDLLVHEAGGSLTGLDGCAPIYNGETTRHGVLAAANNEMQPELLVKLAEVALERDRAGLPA